MSRFEGVCSWAVALLVPLVVIGFALRVVLLPSYLQLEYRMPYFPPDDYGFSVKDRIHWATFASEYLVNDSKISFLRRKLGQERFAAAWDEGRALPLEQAVASALES